MQKKYFLVIVVVFLLFVGVLGYMRSQTSWSDANSASPTTSEANSANENSYLLPGFPSEVPLYEQTKISSSKFFVNDDTSATYLYGGPVNYYNVVFYTEAQRSELFAEYAKLLDTVDVEESSDSQLVGTMGTYTLSVSQYDEDSEDVYLKVIIPSEEYQKTNRYFENYPKLVTIDPSWIEKESSYGLLNQKGGEEEYTQYFVLDTENLPEAAGDEPFQYFYQKYAEQNSTQDNFVKDDEETMLSWTAEGYDVTLTFSESHSRVYLMIRKPL